MGRRLRSSPVVLVALLLCGAPGVALADRDAEQKALARTLFDEGRSAMTANRVDEACSKFQESYRFDPGGGTLLNLGICHEKQGKMASAFAELNESVTRAEREGRPERKQTAQEHLAVVTPKVSHLTVVVAPEASVEGFVLALDGTPLGKAAWGVALPLDPGDHVVEAKAPGKRALKVSTTVSGDADTKQVAIPPLEDEPVVPSAPPSWPAPQPGPAPAPAPARSPLRTIGWGAVGVGVAGLAIGAAFGLVATVRWNKATHDCPGATCPSQTTLQSDDGAGTWADVSTVGFVVGGIGVAAGAVLLFTTPTAPMAKLRILPLLGRDQVGVGLRGAL